MLFSIKRLRTTLNVGVAALALGGCGGGSDGAGSPTPTANLPPTISSAATASVVENVTGSIYTVAATDPERATLAYSIAGGADAAAFSLSGNSLSFVKAPDYDLPTDADGNNVYQVRLNVTDGANTTALDLQVTVTNSKEGISVKRIATGFVDPVAIVAIPGDTQMFVAERGGKIYLLDPVTGVKTLFQTISTSTDGERGLKALAVSPTYATDGNYFILLTAPDGSVYVTGCRRRGTFLTPDCSDISMFVAGAAHADTNNYGAFMGYAPDGKLYIATGDAGGSKDPTGSSQRDSSLLGKLIRVDNNPDPYAGAAPRFFITTIVAKGFRNPRGGAFYNGGLLLGDRGESAKEEVSFVSLAGSGNYGWAGKEGTTIVGTVPAGAIDPAIEYPHVAGGGIVGGYVYRGTVASLRNHYVFADQRGTIYSLPTAGIVAGSTAGVNSLQTRTEDFAPDKGSLGQPVAFGENNQGEMFVIGASGDIFQITAE